VRVVIALGGNALLRRGEPAEAGTQRRNVATAEEAVAALSQPGVSHLLVARAPGETPQGVVADIDVIALCTSARR